MSDTPYYVVDISEMQQRLSKGSHFSPATYESWIAREYTKNWHIPCVSATLLEMTERDYHTFVDDKRQIVESAELQRVDPLSYLPRPDELWRNEGGIWLFVNGRYLLMGDGRAIKKLWRSMRT